MTGDESVPTLFEQRRGTDRRADQRARYELALGASGVGMWDWDIPADVLSWDERTNAIFGLPPHSAVTYGRYLSLLEPQDREPVHRIVGEALDPGGTGRFEMEFRVRTPSGERRIIASRGQTIFSNGGAAPRPLRLVGSVLDITERRRLEGEREQMRVALRHSEQRDALAARATHSVLWDWDLLQDTVVWSDGVHRVFGYEAGTVPHTPYWWIERIHPDDRARVEAGLRRVIDSPSNGNDWHEAYRFRCADGHYAVVVDRGHVARDGTGRGTRMIGAMDDATEREQLAERLRQAQKMEAIGQLAGGVAHDFNNLLTVIIGNLEFAQSDLPPDHPVRRDLTEIDRAAGRARDLIQQLLAFSRKQTVSLQPLDLSEVVRGAESLLRRVIGEEILLDVHLAPTLPAILADRSQLEQILMNLAVNARDAMLTAGHGTQGRGGSLQIDTSEAVLSPEAAEGLPGPLAGPVVCLRVRDSGHGMDATTRARAFEPFFTTKAIGAGTGLGLATVFGIVRQFGGAIRLESIPGSGTLFTLYFPIAKDAAIATIASPPVMARARGTATILLVEDESAVRTAARRMLERQGFTVVEARHGADAVLIWHERQDQIDCVVTDLRMPEMGGRELIEQLRGERPALPVVYMSGYSERSVPDATTPGTTFVEKPFTGDILIGAVQVVLGVRAE
jgi:PAS domain S-box-containing protein